MSNRGPQMLIPGERGIPRPLLLLVGMFLALGVLYSVINPIFEAGDELWHYPVVQHIATTYELPVQDPNRKTLWEQEGGEPPLYYAISAAATFWIDTSDLEARLWRNPFSRNIGVPLAYGNKNLVVHTPAENFPWSGTTLAVHLARLVSIIFAALTVAVTFFLSKETAFGDERMALLATALVAFNPMFLFISASVNNDSLAAAAAALALLLCARLVRMGATTSRLAALGIVTGLGALVKVSDLALLPMALAAAAWVSFSSRSLQLLLKAFVLICIPAAAIAGWWYVRNYLLYGDPLGLNVWLAIAGGRPPVTLTGLLGEFQGFRISFWGNFGGVNLIAADWVYTVLDLFSLLALVGLIAAALKREFPPSLLIPLIWYLVVMAALIRWTVLTYASQGRLIFPAMSAVAVLLAFGLVKLNGYLSDLCSRVFRIRLNPSGRPFLAVLLAAFLFSFALLTPFLIIAPAYAPPVRMAPDAAVPNPVHIVFGDDAARPELAGYESARSIHPGEELPLTLYWRTAAAVRDDLYVYIHLFDAGGKLIGQWDALPGNGNYPTLLWQPNEIILDRYRVPVSNDAGSQQLGRVEAGLARVGSVVPLAARDPKGTSITPVIAQFKLALKQRTPATAPGLFRFGSAFDVVQLGVYGERSTMRFQVLPPRAAAVETPLRASDILHLAVTVRAVRAPSADFKFFYHFTDPTGKIVAQHDAPPLNGNYPTSFWDDGEQVTDDLTLKVPNDLAAGDYQIEFGMYNAADETRLQVAGNGDVPWRALGDRLVLAPIRGE